MRCSNCGTENAAGSRFCNQCATPLGKQCPRCAAENVATAKFCSQCAAPLDGSSPPPPQTETHDSGLVGERRHLTILFCDLVGSTTLAAQLDPEEWRATVAAYQRAATAAVTRFGGEVVRYVGDGIMAFFGYPVAHDNDAERAVRGGLAILDAIAQLNQSSARTNLAVRIGIDSGPVVVGGGTGQAVDAFGDTANIAARVEAAAEPGTLMISDATHRLVSGLFVVEDRGAHQLKGIERPLPLYRVIRPSGVRGRLEAVAASHGLTPFVGRDDELRSLMNRWQRVIEGEGQVALIVGEAGMGKSRLVQRFHEQIAGTPHSWIEAGSAAFFQNTPFYAVTELLHQLVWKQNLDRLADYLRTMQSESVDAARAEQSSDSNHAGDQLTRLQSELARAGLKPAEAIPLLAPLLGLPLTADYPPSSLAPEQQRRRLLAILVEWVLGAAAAQPLIIATEDLHWADPSTLELIQILVEQGAKTRLLLLYTARPEFRAPWPPRAHHTQINLNRLSLNNVRAIVEQVAARNALTDETIATVIERTGGVPLFVEELTRAVLESGDAKLTGRAIPATLHDSLMARLDRLGPAKEVAQVGAVLGAEFSYELLHAVHPIAEENLQSALRSLTDAELLYVRGIAPDATYQFKHALIRDAAYEALLKSRRKELHLIVARTIDENFPVIRETQPEVLARHWTEAGETEPAIDAWQNAGERASKRDAYREAEQHYLNAISLLPPIDDARRCNILFALGQEQRKGGKPPKAQESLIRAGEIAEALGMTERVVDAALNLARLTFTVGLSGQSALRLLDNALEKVGPADSVLRAKILGGLATILGFSGMRTRAIEYAEQGLAIARRVGDMHAVVLNLHAAMYALQEPQDLNRRLAYAEEGVEVGRHAETGQTLLFTEQLWELQSHFSTILLELGNLANADAEFEAWARIIETRDRPFHRWIVAGRGAARALMRGDFEQTEKLAQQALEIGRGMGAENVASGVYGQQMFALDRERGRLRELEPLVRLFLQHHGANDAWRPGLAVIYAELDRREEARTEFEHLASDDFRDLPSDALWTGSISYLADVCVFLGDKSRASILYELLLPFDGRNVIIGFAVVCYGAIARYLGMLAGTLERWADAAVHFEDALAMNARMEALPWLAHTQYQYATMLLRRNASSDRDRAFALLDSALATAGRLGMRSLEERVGATLKTHQLGRQPHGAS